MKKLILKVTMLSALILSVVFGGCFLSSDSNNAPGGEEQNSSSGGSGNDSGNGGNSSNNEQEYVICDKAPLSVKYAYSGTSEHVYSICELEEIDCKVEKYLISEKIDVKLTFKGKKTFDNDGETGDSRCYWRVKLYDKDNVVVENGMCWSPNLAVGEKFVDVKKSFYGLELKNAPYTVKIIDYVI